MGASGSLHRARLRAIDGLPEGRQAKVRQSDLLVENQHREWGQVNELLNRQIDHLEQIAWIYYIILQITLTDFGLSVFRIVCEALAQYTDGNW
jgi:hypothetical protein